MCTRQKSDKTYLCFFHFAVSQSCRSILHWTRIWQNISLFCSSRNFSNVSEHSLLDKNLTKYIFVQVFSIVSEQCARDYFSIATANINSGIGKIENRKKGKFQVSANWFTARIYKEGWTERAIILCKLNKSLLKSSK